jgi:putative ABC transport system ATP-binding protein
MTNESSPHPLIQAVGIRRHDPLRHVPLLQPVNFSLNGGDRIAISGPSGSGKSVFLRALALLDPIDAGQVLWHGQPIPRTGIPAYRRHVAYVAQRPAVLDGSVEDNLRYPFTLRAYGNSAFDRNTAAILLSHAGREAAFLEKRAADLSGGEAQIVALVRVLQLAPEVLLLDEPTASLDPASTAAIERLVDRWFDGGAAHARSPDVNTDADTGADTHATDQAPAATPHASGLPLSRHASIWVSHDPAQVTRVGTRHLVMRAGVLAEETS